MGQIDEGRRIVREEEQFIDDRVLSPLITCFPRSEDLSAQGGERHRLWWERALCTLAAEAGVCQERPARLRIVRSRQQLPDAGLLGPRPTSAEKLG